MLQRDGHPTALGEAIAMYGRVFGVHGAYSFVLPDLAPGGIRDLRDPDAGDEDDE